MQPDPFWQALPAQSVLPDALRHLRGRQGTYSGFCDVERGRDLLVRMALWLGRFPTGGRNVPVSLSVTKRDRAWIWVRNFNGQTTRSRIGYRSGYVLERMGPLTLWLKPVLFDGQLSIHLHRLRLWGIPCPKLIVPRSNTFEWRDDEGRFRFDVSARMPVLGLLIRYHGWLTADHAKQDVG